MSDAHVVPLSGVGRVRSRPMTVASTSRDPAALYRRLAPAVLGYLRSQGATDPEDVLGDVFVAVVRDLDRFRGDDDALRRWVFTIAHHRVVDQRRRRARRPRLRSIDDEPRLDLVTGTTSEDTAAPDPALLAALASLTPDQREVVGLRIVADLSVEAVARIVGKRPDAVRALHHRALARLAERLDRAD